MIESDAQLVQWYLRTGDEQHLEELVKRNLPPLLRYLHVFTGNARTTEDIAQETFVKVWKNLKRYNPAMEFRGWLFTIAKRTAIDELRKKQAVPFSSLSGESGEDFAQTIPDGGLSVAQLVADTMTGRELTLAVNGLSAVPAVIVRMKSSGDMTFSQIALKLRIPLNTAKSHYRRALRALRKTVTRE